MSSNSFSSSIWLEEATHLFSRQRHALTRSNLDHALLASLWITAHQAIQLGLHLRGDPCPQSLELLQRCHQNQTDWVFSNWGFGTSPVQTLKRWQHMRHSIRIAPTSPFLYQRPSPGTSSCELGCERLLRTR